VEFIEQNQFTAKDVDGRCRGSLPLTVYRRSCLRLAQELVIEANAEFLERFLEALKTFLAHEKSKADAPFRPDDCRPVVLYHACGVTLLHAHDRVADALLQPFGRCWRLQDRVEYALMKKIHDLSFLRSELIVVHELIFLR